jgi:hypothetical protein
MAFNRAARADPGSDHRSGHGSGQGDEQTARTIPGVRFIAPLAFVLASMILYWATWTELRVALPVLLVAVVVYAYQQWRMGVDWRDVRLGAWLVGYLVAILVMSVIGSRDFGGTNAIPAPWDTIVVAVIGAAAYVAGVRAGTQHLAIHPAPEPYQRSSRGSTDSSDDS